MKRWTWHDVIGTSSAQLQSRFSFRSSHTCQGPNPGQGYSGHHTFSEEGLWDGVGKEALGQGTLPARTDTRNPVWPSCLPCRRIAGIHPVSSPHPHQPWPRSPCFLEGHGCRHVNVDRARWPSRYCWCRELGQAGKARDGGCVCLWQYLGQRAERGSQALGEVPSVVCRLCQQPARTPLLPQWPHCSQ